MTIADLLQGMRGVRRVLPGLFLLLGIQLSGAGAEWRDEPFGRSRDIGSVGSGKPGLKLLAPAETGVVWTNSLPVDLYTQRQNLINGAGIAIGDYDGDGRVDFYACTGAGANGLFRNLGGWRFEEVAGVAGVTCAGQQSTGAVFADVNADGRLDLLVTSFTGPNACFLNLGGGRFTNVTEWAGLVSKGGSTSMALADLDADGDLDLYVCYFGIEALLRDGVAFSTRMVGGKLVATGRHARRLEIVGPGQVVELGEPDMLYLNDGAGRFTPVNWRERFRDEKGQPVEAPLDFGLAVQLRDADLDGDTDIYVCNDFQTPDRFWLNDGTGHFRAVPVASLPAFSFASMGVDFADVDRDGRLDFMTAEMLSRDYSRHLRQMSPMPPSLQAMAHAQPRKEVARNAFYWNRGDGTYAEIAWFAGLAASDWSWTPIFLDVDLDGFEDLLISNGHLHDVNDRDAGANRRATPGGARQGVLAFPPLDVPKAAFRNRGDLTFEDMSRAWGFDSTRIAHGMALGDFDEDGDLDVVLNAVNGPPLLYRNEATAARIAVRVRGRAPNTQGAGAQIRVSGGAAPVQIQEILAGGRYLSGDEAMRTFAVGDETRRVGIEVRWASGSLTRVADAAPGRIYEITEPERAGSGSMAKTSPGPGSPALFEDVSGRLNHTHVDPAYDEGARQPGLPRLLSRLGPGIAWIDVDGDGRDDLAVGGGRGDRVAVFRSDEQGGFSPIGSRRAGGGLLPGDSGGLLGFPAGGGRRSILASIADYEDPGVQVPSLIELALDGGGLIQTVLAPSGGESAGPMALADVDLDGDLDLFVGGRVIGGRYPDAAGSRLYIRDAAGWKPGQRWDAMGMVTSAVFSDLDGDGDPDLVVACEWGPVRSLINQAGRFEDTTEAWGLSGYTGLWSALTVLDADADGRMDLVAGNWGRNTPRQRAPKGPWTIYYGELGRPGIQTCIEAFWEPALGRTVPVRDMESLASELPWLRPRFGSHAAFSRAGMEEILGERRAEARSLRATTLDSMLFLNRGTRFEGVPLPAQAQWTAVTSLAASDLDGDGRVDLFVGLNFYDVPVDDERHTTGLGLLLLGKGAGVFEPVSATESGLRMHGQQRGAGVADFDGDGRVDLAVAQNGSATRLFRNGGARAGLRTRFRGAEGNPDGVGVRVRARAGSWAGPVIEVRAGGGCFSQDSVVQVLTAPEPIGSLEVRWPGGISKIVEVPTSAKEIVVGADGNVTSAR